MQSVHKMRSINLLHMSHVAWSFCLCVGCTDVLCEKSAEPIEMLFGGREGQLTLVGPRNHILDVGQGQVNPFCRCEG